MLNALIIGVKILLTAQFAGITSKYQILREKDISEPLLITTDQY